MITIEYYTLDNKGNDIKYANEFIITQDMIVRLLEENIDLDKNIGEHVDEENLYIKRK
jgi:hypothetical protein